MRRIIEINDQWDFYKGDQKENVTLPHTWNAVDGQDGGNDYYRGECRYERKLSMPKLEAGESAWLEIPAAAMTARIYLNDTLLAIHCGGYSTFRVNLTPHLQDENTLQICVDNSQSNSVYPQRADFTFYGGLYRGARLIVVPKAHFALDYAGSQGIKITPRVEQGNADVLIEAWVSGDADAVSITIDGETKHIPVKAGYAAVSFHIENVHLWDGLDDPYLYTAVACVSEDCVSTRFGCRSFEMDAQKGFLLNGRPYPLRGVSRHQDFVGVGNALTLEMHQKDMEIIKELGANSLRLAHYQHAQEFYDLCDEMGLVVWAEIPYITLHMPQGCENTLSQMKELVMQNYNHPSIVCWGLSNEITAASEVNEDLLENHRLLNGLCHRLDSTRPTTMAHVFMLEIDSPITSIPDVASYNLYFGWYLGNLEQNDAFFDAYHQQYPDRAIGFSEYGADANPQFQAENPQQGDYTEGYQCLYHEHMLRMIEARPWLWSTYVWNLFDFGADGRDEGGKSGLNQKGLVTIDRKLRKDAFYLYKAYWSKQPFVHVCGRRYADRAQEITQVKVYSNQAEVSLFVDGKLHETKKGDHAFVFDVPLTGSHNIEAVAGDYKDSITLHKVNTSNAAYMFANQGDVTNWFDKADFNPDCYSIRDTLGTLYADPQAGQIVSGMMDAAANSRGDVAMSVKDNANLQKMLMRMPLEKMLKQAGDAISPEQIKQLNNRLQGIKKTQ